MENAKLIRDRLLAWYEVNKRDLPWRKDRDPYRVWLSEIMLQQTRVEAVIGYYGRFLEMLPDISMLAQADDDRLMKLWEGLGYYSRARNLKKAAVTVMERFGGRFPSRYEDILSLPGIGAYTAGAIASICFDRPTPAVDGNVLRVYSRLTESPAPIDREATKKETAAALRALYREGNCAGVTQGLMELGATVCLPNGKPLCARCPLKDVCRAFLNGTWARYPVRGEKKARRIVQKTVYLLHSDGCYAIRKRPEKGLLAGLWELPGVDLPENAGENEVISASPVPVSSPGKMMLSYTHIFTHVEWHVCVWRFEAAARPDAFVWADAQSLLSDYALPSAFRPAVDCCAAEGEEASSPSSLSETSGSSKKTR